MADLNVGAGALGARVKAHVSAAGPTGVVGLAALVVLIFLAWHFWDQDDTDTTNWLDPEQPAIDASDPGGGLEVGPQLARARRWPGSIPGAT